MRCWPRTAITPSYTDCNLATKLTLLLGKEYGLRNGAARNEKLDQKGCFMQADRCEDRTVLRISGADRVGFLQGLVTNDIAQLDGALVYAALLTPQGKYLADFFLYSTDDAIMLDVKSDLAARLVQRLSMYKLRAAVTIEPTETQVFRGIDAICDGAMADPRHVDLGWRFYGDLDADPANVDWTALRVALCVPETGVELIPNDSYILEQGFERLNGVDFKKGCYVGQEVTARMKHKTELRKGLALVTVDGNAEIGAEITAGGKSVGQLFTQSEQQGLAYLRFDRAGPDMTAGDATVHFSKD